MKIKAIVPWFGSKRRLATRIASECCQPNGRPPKSFWELGCGSLAVSLAMPSCAHHHAVDVHGELINLARVIKDPMLGPLLYRRLRRVLNHETLFMEARDEIRQEDDLFGQAVERPPLERAYRYFIISWQGRNGVAGTERMNYQPAIRWTSGGGHGAVRFRGAVDSIPAWRRRLRDITIVQRDMFEVLAKIEDQPGTVIYIDPPYLRDGDARSGACAYQHEFAPRQHVRLRDSLLRYEHVRIVISYYENAVLREWYAGWTFIDLATQKNLHVQNRRGEGTCDSPEVLIINGPSHVHLPDSPRPLRLCGELPGGDR